MTIGGGSRVWPKYMYNNIFRGCNRPGRYASVINQHYKALLLLIARKLRLLHYNKRRVALLAWLHRLLVCVASIKIMYILTSARVSDGMACLAPWKRLRGAARARAGDAEGAAARMSPISDVASVTAGAIIEKSRSKEIMQC